VQIRPASQRPVPVPVGYKSKPKLTIVNNVVLLKDNKVILKDEYEIMESHNEFLTNKRRGLIHAQLGDKGHGHRVVNGISMFGPLRRVVDEGS
jgi:hypothetical protein